jgi:hypothetical protein
LAGIDLFDRAVIGIRSLFSFSRHQPSLQSSTQKRLKQNVPTLRPDLESIVVRPHLHRVTFDVHFKVSCYRSRKLPLGIESIAQRKVGT